MPFVTIDSFSDAAQKSISSDFGLKVSQGLVPKISHINKFGRNTGTVANDAIWAPSTPYKEPATAELCNVASTSQHDSSTGIGARTVTVRGVNENYDLVDETVTLGGLANVSTANKYLNIHHAYVATALYDAGCSGDITLTSTAAQTPVMTKILVGYNEAQSTVYMVPRNHNAYINNINLELQNAAANATIDIGFFKKEFGSVFRVQNDWLFVSDVQNTSFSPFISPIRFEEKSTALFKCIAASSSFDVSVDYDIWLVSGDSA